MKQYGAPTVMASWQFSGVQEYKRELNPNAVIHKEIRMSFLLYSYLSYPYSSPLTTQSAFIPLA